MNIFFALTLFLSAFLVFSSEPMIGKMLLPYLGGAPSVWTTCVLFFQTMLLAGYAYAYLIERVSRLRTRLLVHLVLMLAGVSFLPIHFDRAANVTDTQHPIFWLLSRLLIAVAVPFGVAVSSAPLLQNWISKTSSSSARDPYFLYAASNAGSLAALVAYPVFIEPRLGLAAQSLTWFAGYVTLVCAVAIAAVIVWKNTRTQISRPVVETQPSSPPPPATRAFWVAAAFVPSALMLAVTNHISANLVAAPFLWVIPLAVYLLTFILAFARGSRLTVARVSSFVPIIFLLSPYVTIGAPVPAGLIWIVLPAHIAILFSGALLCHTALAASRPDPRYLTEFYFWLALGGALAGVFAVVIAPALFSTVFEYPLLIATLGFFRLSRNSKEEWNREDLLYPALIGLLLLTGWIVLRFASSPDIREGTAVLLVNGGFVLIYAFRSRAYRFALALAVFAIGSAMILPSYLEDGQRLYVARNFFGVKKVLFDASMNARKMLHGDTIHGVESIEADKSGVPLSYYHPTGPAGDVMKMMKDRPNQPNQDVGIIGLGTGSLAAYATSTRRITFFELDPQMIDIAHSFFTYLRRCADNCTVIAGDGRLKIAEARPGQFDLLIIDAFSSDSIPAHLVSQEAVSVYVSRLKSDGVLLFHVSNRYLDVQTLVSAVLVQAGLTTFIRRDVDHSITGKSGSDYVAGAREATALGSIQTNPSWQRVAKTANLRPWTDDYSNVLSLVHWR